MTLHFQYIGAYNTHFSEHDKRIEESADLT